MGDLGICGVLRGKTYVTTTISNELQERPKDLVKRAFTAPAPNPTLGGRHRAPRGALEPRGSARPPCTSPSQRVGEVGDSLNLGTKGRMASSLDEAGTDQHR